MAAIPTMHMYKGDEVIIINTPDYDKFVGAGYDSKAPVVPKEPEAPKVPTAPKAPTAAAGVAK